MAGLSLVGPGFFVQHCHGGVSENPWLIKSALHSGRSILYHEPVLAGVAREYCHRREAWRGSHERPTQLTDELIMIVLMGFCYSFLG